MQGRLVSTPEALSAGWRVFKEHALVLVGVSIIYGLIMIAVIAASRIPTVSIIYNILIAGPLAGGTVIVALKAVRDQHPSIGDLFAGFRDYRHWLGMYWLLSAMLLLSDIPIAIGAVIVSGIRGLKHFHGIPPSFDYAAFAKSVEANPALPLVLVMIGIASMVVIFLILLRYAFAYYEAADGAGIIESYRRSAELTMGIRPRLLVMGIMLCLFAVAGILACGVGVVVTAVVAQLAFAYLYTQLKGETQAAAPQAPGPP